MIRYLIFLFYVSFLNTFFQGFFFTLKPCRESPINIYPPMSAFEMELSSFELIFVSRCPDVNDLYSSEFHQREITTKGFNTISKQQ